LIWLGTAPRPCTRSTRRSDLVQVPSPGRRPGHKVNPGPRSCARRSHVSWACPCVCRGPCWILQPGSPGSGRRAGRIRRVEWPVGVQLSARARPCLGVHAESGGDRGGAACSSVKTERRTQ
jgi:hypothetical protein